MSDTDDILVSKLSMKLILAKSLSDFHFFFFVCKSNDLIFGSQNNVLVDNLDKVENKFHEM